MSWISWTRSVRTSLALLAAMLVAACGSSATSPAHARRHRARAAHARTARHAGDPWAGCSVAFLRGSVHVISCPDAELRIMRAGAVRGADAVRWMARTGGVADEDLELRMRARYGYAMARHRGREGMVYIATPRPEVVIRCTIPTDAQRSACLIRFDAVAADGPPPGVQFAGAQMMVAGHPLTVPAGCAMLGTERIVCSSAALDWRDDARPGYLDEFGTMMEGLGLHVVERANTSCRVGSVTGDGRIFVVRKDAVEYVTLVCEVPYGRTTSIAQCIGYDPRTAQSVPAPCDQVLVHVPLAH